VQHWRGQVYFAVALGVAYFLSARLGLALLVEPEDVAVFWPASGIAAGILIALGPGVRVPVAASVFVATLAANLLSDRTIWSALAFGLCNAGEALLTAWLIGRRFGPVFKLDDLRRVVGFLAAAVIGSGVAAVGATVAMWQFQDSTVALPSVWGAWFASDALGIITVAPLLIEFAAAVRDRPPARELIEGSVALVTLAAVSAFALVMSPGPWATLLPAALLFPLVLWLAARCRPVFATAAAFILAVAVVCTTTYGIGRFGDPGLPFGDRILAAQISIVATTLCALVLAALFAERRQHEVVLGESEARLRSILEAANVIAWDVDLIHRTGTGVGPVGRFFDKPEGFEISDLAGFLTCVHPGDRNRVLSIFEAAIRGEAPYRVEFRIQLSDGGVRWAAAEGAIVHNDQGEPIRMLGVTHDIAERKKAAQALTESEARLRLALDAGGMGVWQLDEAARVTLIDEIDALLLGLPPDTRALSMADFIARIHPDDRAAMTRHAADSRRLGSDYEHEFRALLPDGAERWLSARGRTVLGPDGKPMQTIGVNFDITAQKQAEERQNLLIAELDHRVKNVLARVAVVARYTREGSDSMDSLVEALEGRIQSMANAHALLSRSRWQGVSLADIVHHELAPYATADNTTIEGPDVTLIDEAMQAVTMVLHELVTNAAKHGALSTRQGRVAVRWAQRSSGNRRGWLRLQWNEADGPPVTHPTQEGFGTSVIRDLIPYELGGDVDVTFAAAGVRCSIEIPLKWISSERPPIPQKIANPIPTRGAGLSAAPPR
jgi:PAS domain S-box-containing protein